MAELVGLVASVVGLAGAAAVVTQTLYKCGRTLTEARTELYGLARDVEDVKIVIEYLSDILRRYEQFIVEQTIKTVGSLIQRCETGLEEIRVTAELSMSKYARIKWLFRKEKTIEHKRHLEGFKSNIGLLINTLILGEVIGNRVKHESDEIKRNLSITAQRNIKLLRSSVISNREIMDRLKAAPNGHSDQREIFLPRSMSPEERVSRAQFESDVENALKKSKPQSPSSEAKSSSVLGRTNSLRCAGGGALVFASDIVTWEDILLSSYKELTSQTPAATTLVDAIPERIRAARESEDESSSDLGTAEVTGETSPMENTDKEIEILLSEWTNASPQEIEECLTLNQRLENQFEGVPSWAENLYQFVGHDPRNAAHWKEKPSVADEETTIQPVSRFAYYPADPKQRSLLDILASEGGAWVWRHENEYQRDYFIGSKKVIQYFMKPRAEAKEDEKPNERTIVGKQWISKEILDKSGYAYKGYGEGSYAIDGKLDPAVVEQLHASASTRTEALLRQLAARNLSQKSKPQKHQPLRSKALALFSFKANYYRDLSFDEGDILELEDIPDSNTGFWTASLNGRKGVVPLSHIRILSDEDVVELSPQNSTASDSGKPQGSPTDEKGQREQAQNGPYADESGSKQAADEAAKKSSRLDKWKVKFDKKRRDTSKTT